MSVNAQAKKLIAFDLDGTLAESKSPLDPEMSAHLPPCSVLTRLFTNYMTSSRGAVSPISYVEVQDVRRAQAADSGGG